MPTQASAPVPVWRAAGGDGSRRGLFDRAVRIHARPAHRLLSQGAIRSSVVFDDVGQAFVADLAGGVQCFSAQGSLRWRTNLGAGISATPVVDSSQPRLFVATFAGSAFALDTVQGAVLWKTRIPTESDPRILSDLLYLPQASLVVLSSWGGRFHALEAETGAERFSWDAGISPWAAATSSGAGTFCCLRAVADHGVELIRMSSTGTESLLFRVSADKRGARRALVAAAPVLDEARSALYFIVNQDTGCQLYAWSCETSKILWSHPLSHTVQATPAIRKDGAVLVVDLGGFIHAVGPTGTPLFKHQAGCEYFLAGGVSEAGGSFYVGDPYGRIHAISANGLASCIFETQRSIEARPSFAPSGDLYVPSMDKSVYVFAHEA